MLVSRRTAGVLDPTGAADDVDAAAEVAQELPLPVGDTQPGDRLPAGADRMGSSHSADIAARMLASSSPAIRSTAAVSASTV